MKTSTILWCLVIAFTVSLSGCSDNAVAPNENIANNQPNPTSLQWEPIQRTPVSETLHRVDGFGDTHIAVGDGGTIIVRHGNGDWQVIPRAFNTLLRAVEMIDEKRALVVGSGVILRTEDAGISWKKVAEPAAFMVDISVSGKFAIAVGTNTMLVSDDFGETWAPPAGVFSVHTYTKVSHHTDLIATAVASGPTQFRTTDGGNNWTQVGVGQLPGVPNDIVFFSEKLGVAVFSNQADVYRTDDGGDTWTQTNNFGVGHIQSLDKVNATTAYAILGTGHIHVTENSGKSWRFETAVPPELGAIIALDASDASHWTSVGALGFVSETTNAGASWQRVSEGRVGTFLSVAFADASIGVAAFSPRLVNSEKALRTFDGGVTWTPVDPQIKRPERVLFSPTGVGLLIGGDEVSRSADDGATWTDISPDANNALRGGAIIDAATFVVCGDNSKVWRTVNAGASWQDVSFDISFDRYEDMEFFSGTSTGIMISKDRSYRSTDSGATWSVINVRATAVACPTDGIAIAVGDEILRSTDGGQTWLIVTVPERNLNAVAFASAAHGVAVGTNGLMLETLDGGLTWNEVTRETSVNLHTVTFRDEQTAVTGGKAGAFLLGTP